MSFNSSNDISINLPFAQKKEVIENDLVQLVTNLDSS